MTANKQNITHIIFVLLAIMAIPSVAFCGDSSIREKLVQELTTAIKAEGGRDIAYESSGQILTIRYGIVKGPINKGQLTSALSTFLKPDIVSKLKKAGFKKGLFIDGGNHVYPFDISTKYYREMEAIFNKMAREK